MKILAIDDLDETRMILKTILRKMGHEAVLAVDGEEGWNTLNETDINFVISDWSMPNMDGIELCKKIRETDLKRYIYFILLTSKNEKSDLIEGMEAGADDFISKPFNIQELKVRVRAGERIIELERDLDLKNKKLTEYNRMLEKDLSLAAELQRSILPERNVEIRKLELTSMFIPSSFVAGDIYDFAVLDEENTAFYLLDVSGHGVSSAMLSFTLNKFLSQDTGKSVIYDEKNDGSSAIKKPSEVLKSLNGYFEISEEQSQYFTIIYGIYNHKENKMTYSNAGHPPPVYLSKTNGERLLKTQSVPCGMFSDSEYDDVELNLEPGDVFAMYSDGVSDSFAGSAAGEPYTVLMEFFSHNRQENFAETLRLLEKRLAENKSDGDIKDDMSVLAIRRKS